MVVNALVGLLLLCWFSYSTGSCAKHFKTSFTRSWSVKASLVLLYRTALWFFNENCSLLPTARLSKPLAMPSATSGHAHSEVLGPMDSGSHLGVRHKRLEPTTHHLVSVFPFFGPLNFKPTLCVWSKLKFQDISTDKGFSRRKFLC